MSPLRGIQSMKQEVTKIKVRLTEVEARLEEEEEKLPFQKEIDALVRGSSYVKVTRAQSDVVEVQRLDGDSIRVTWSFIRFIPRPKGTEVCCNKATLEYVVRLSSAMGKVDC